MANAAYNSQRDAVLQAEIAAKQTTQKFFNILDYGAVQGTVRQVADGVTNSTTTVTSATLALTSADVGKSVIILNGVATTGAAVGNSFYGTIASVTNSTTFVVNTAVGFTASACPIMIGTDATTAIQNATNAASAAGGGTVFLPGGNWLVLGQTVSSTLVGIQCLSTVGYQGAGIDATYVWGAIKSQTGGTFDNFGQSGTNCYHVDFFNFTIDNTFCTMSAYASRLKGISCPWVTGINILNMRVCNTLATAIACDNASQAVLFACEVYHFGRGNNGGATTPGGNGIGIGVGGANTNALNPYGKESYLISQCTAWNGRNYGIYFEAQAGAVVSTSGARIENCTAYGCKFGFGDAGVFRIEIIGCSADNCIALPNATQIPNGLPNASLTTDARVECGSGIVVNAGTISTPPGYKGIIANCTSTSNAGSGIALVTTGSQTLQGYTISNSRFQANAAHGIALYSGSSVAMSAVQVNGNASTGNVKAGMYCGGAGTGGYEDLMINDNIFQGNATTTGTASFQCGLCIDNLSISTHLQGNIFTDRLDGSTTQKYGLIWNSGTHTGAQVVNNDFSGNVTAGILFTVTPTASNFIGNLGYNPVGASTVSVGASPWTYTAGNTQEFLYLTGGTFSSMTIGGQSIGATQSILLQPNQSVVITYTVAPTAVTNKL